jgi:ABC-type Fe3+ transport system permease subunit
VFSALALVAGASLGEVAAVSLFATGGLTPLPLLISRFMSQYRFDEAQAVSAVLFMLSAALMAFVFLGSRGGRLFDRVAR